MSAKAAPTKTGKDIDAYCTKCKLELAHVIIAMVGDRVARVKCNTCNSEHAYRRPPTAREKREKAARAERAATASQTRTPPTAGDYDRLMKGKDLARAKRYAAAVQFAKDEVLDHATFGVGVVTLVKQDKKIEVAFKDGAKVLIHARE